MPIFPSSLAESRRALARLCERRPAFDDREVSLAARSDEIERALIASRPVLVATGEFADITLPSTSSWLAREVVVSTGEYGRGGERELAVTIAYDTFVRFLEGRVRFFVRGRTSESPPYVRAAPCTAPILERAGPETGLARLFGPEHCRRPTLWAGARGSRTPPHLDMLDNLAVVIVGTKTVSLWPPSAVDPTAIEPGSDRGSFWLCQSLARPAPIRVQLAPGIGLVLPAGWVHEVHTTSSCVMVNYFNELRAPMAIEAG
jgi:hypothetical protein